MPGATETDFFERADLLDTKIGQSKKDDPADVARTGFKAMMRGDGDVVSGWHNKLQSAIANITPAAMLAEQHRKQAEPGSGRKQQEVRNEGARLARQGRHPLRHGLRSRDRGSARRHHQGDELRHLRLRPASLSQLHPRHDARRHHGPRDDGRGRRGRLWRQRQAQEGRPHRRALHHLVRAMRAVQARQLLRLRDAPTARKRSRTRSSGTRRRACSATRI